METAKLVCCFLFDLIFFNKNIKKFNTSQDWLLPPKPVVYKETMKAAGAHTEIRGAEKWIKNTVEITWGGNQLRVPSVVSIRPDSFEITDPIFNKYMWLVCIYQVYCLYLSTKPICRFLFQKENPLWWKMHTVGFAVTLWNQKKNKQNSYISYMLPDKTWNHWRVMSGRNQQRTILCTERLSYFMVWNTGSLQTVVSKYHRGPFSAVLFFSSVSRPDIFLLFS